MVQKIPKWAQRVASAIAANVKDVDANRITWAEFSARQAAAWNSVSRGELSIIGSACYRRMMAVHAAFRQLDATGSAA